MNEKDRAEMLNRHLDDLLADRPEAWDSSSEDLLRVIRQLAGARDLAHRSRGRVALRARLLSQFPRRNPSMPQFRFLLRAASFGALILFLIAGLTWLLSGSGRISDLAAAPTATLVPDQTTGGISGTPEPANTDSEVAVQEIDATATPPASPTPRMILEEAVTDEPVSLDELSICIIEPSVPLNAFSDSLVNRIVLQSLFDGPVDYINFKYTPVILENDLGQVPNEISVEFVNVKSGDLIFDIADQRIYQYEGPETEMLQQRVVFRLMENITWSDGSNLNAADSIYAYDNLVLRGIDFSDDWYTPSEEMLLLTSSYILLDERTIEWVGIPGYVGQSTLGMYFSPIPQGTNDDLNTAWPSVTWGPYQIGEWRPGEYLDLVKNENYFRSADGLPRINRVVFQFVEPPYEANLFQRIGLHDCHILSVLVASQIPLNTWPELVESDEISLVTSTTTTGIQLVFNLNSDQAGTLTADVDARKAMAYCVNREEIAGIAMGAVSTSFVHPSDPAHLELLADYSFDPTHMLEYFEAHPNITAPAKLSLAFLDSPSYEEVAHSIANSFSDCGINLELVPLARNDFYSPWPDGTIFSLKFDMAITLFSAEDGAGCRSYLSRNRPSEGNITGLNIGGFENPEFDEFCIEGLTSNDTNTYIEAIRNAQTIWEEQMPALPLYWQVMTTGIDCHVRGYALDPSAYELWNIEEFWLAEVCD